MYNYFLIVVISAIEFSILHHKVPRYQLNRQPVTRNTTSHKSVFLFYGDGFSDKMLSILGSNALTR